MVKQLYVVFLALIMWSSSRVQAQIVVTPAHGGTGICTNNAQNRVPPYGVPVLLDTMMIRETNTGDFGGGTIDSVRLQVPPGWVLWSAIPFYVYVTTSLSSEIDSLELIYDINHITMYVRCAHTSVRDTIFLSGFGMVPATDYAANGYIYPTSVYGMPGIDTGTSGTNFCSLSLSPQPIIAPYDVWLGSAPAAYDSTPAGTWSVTDTTVATINPVTGVITPVFFGLDTIIYKVDTCWTKHAFYVHRWEAVPQVNGVPDDMLLYPNPAHDMLTVQSRGTLVNDICISNMMGQVIYKKVIQGSDHAEIDVSKYAPGLYLLRVNNNEVRKWLKE